MSASIQPQTIIGSLSQIPAVLNSVRSSSCCGRLTTRRPEARETSAEEPEFSETTQNALKELGVEAWLAAVDLSCPESILRLLHDPYYGTQGYVSANTFFHNKHGFSESTVLSWSRQHAQRHTPMHIQTRGLFSPSREADTRDWGTKASRTSPATRSLDADVYSMSFGEKSFEKDIHQKDLSMAYNLGSKARETGLFKGISKAKRWWLPFSKDRLAPAGQSLASNDPRRFKLLIEKHKNSQEYKKNLHEAFSQGYHDTEQPFDPSAVRTMRRRALLVFGALAVVYYFVYNMSTSGNNMGVLGNLLKPSSFPALEEKTNVTFDDVKGVEEAKEELLEVVRYLRNPEKFRAIGAKLPKGVLLVGSPGTGKTLLARAVAGEAEVPFFHASGSEFEEVFVGTGAKRVRQLFQSAKLVAPCVIFLDEIDSVGGKRVSSAFHPYANQTINQLLSEMDGFEKNEGIILIGATNKRENLDSALMRPGRFDVQVQIHPPDLKGRTDILKMYLSKVKVGYGVDVPKLAKMTTGCTGADLENIVNQGALRAAMDDLTEVCMKQLEFAIDKCLMGPAKKNKIPHKATNVMTAIHEAGHTLVAYYTKYAMPINKVTILQRGTSLGHTSFVPLDDHENVCKALLLAQLDVAMGGRVAEEIGFGVDGASTGASHDFSTATNLATAMVKSFGMSEKVGTRVIDDGPYDPLSRMPTAISPSLSEEIDSEIKRLLQESYDRARNILKTHSGELMALSEALYEQETLDAEQVRKIIEANKHNSKARFRDLDEVLAIKRKHDKNAPNL